MVFPVNNLTGSVPQSSSGVEPPPVEPRSDIEYYFGAGTGTGTGTGTVDRPSSEELMQSVLGDFWDWMPRPMYTSDVGNVDLGPAPGEGSGPLVTPEFPRSRLFSEVASTAQELGEAVEIKANYSPLLGDLDPTANVASTSGQEPSGVVPQPTGYKSNVLNNSRPPHASGRKPQPQKATGMKVPDLFAPDSSKPVLSRPTTLSLSQSAAHGSPAPSYSASTGKRPNALGQGRSEIAPRQVSQTNHIMGVFASAQAHSLQVSTSGGHSQAKRLRVDDAVQTNPLDVHAVQERDKSTPSDT